MIYCVDPGMYPLKDKIIEELRYRDENDFEWGIARTADGLFVKYLGVPYFKETFFSCNLSNGEHVLLNNTGCIYCADPAFETFVEIRDVIKSGHTDEIWEVFEELFTERLEHDGRINEWETIKK